MKILAKLLLAIVLMFSLSFSFTTVSNAETVTEGFYVNNNLELTTKDFIDMSKSDKKVAIKKYLMSANLVLGGIVYKFLDAVLAVDAAAFIKVGQSIADYETKHGKLQGSTSPTKPEVEFKITSIE